MRLHLLSLWFFMLATLIFGLAHPAHAENLLPLLDRSHQMDVQLASRLTGPKPLMVDGLPLDKKNLLTFYKQRSFLPVWVDETALSELDFTPRALEAAEILAQADADGLQPSDYAASLIAARLKDGPARSSAADTELLLSHAFMHYLSDLKNGRPLEGFSRTGGGHHAAASMPFLLEGAAAAPSLGTYAAGQAPPHRGYHALKAMLAELQAVRQRGGWASIPSGKRYKSSIRPEEADARLAQLTTRMIAEEFLPEGTSVPPRYQGPLLVAIRQFQFLHQLKPDGVIGPRTIQELNVPVEKRIEQVALNMERWRWLPRDLGPKHVAVNIPGFTLIGVENGEEMLNMPVIVGQKKHHTPILNTVMTQVIFHPYWNAPPRLGYEYVLPKILKNPGAVGQEGYELLSRGDGGLQQVNLETVDLASMQRDDFQHLLFRQKPGPRNALGPVKFYIANSDSVYLHGTPQKQLFNQNIRAESSGCIRVYDPEALAQFVLSENTAWDSSRITEEMSAEEEKPTYVKLKSPVPVYLLYMTNWVDSQGLHYHPDIYRRDRDLAKLIHAPAGQLTAARDPIARQNLSSNQ
jgi:murein L,D-transpeptidase YcbB/YkuD